MLGRILLVGLKKTAEVLSLLHPFFDGKALRFELRINCLKVLYFLLQFFIMSKFNKNSNVSESSCPALTMVRGKLIFRLIEIDNDINIVDVDASG